jgi:type IV pilus assembly protein PilA
VSEVYQTTSASTVSSWGCESSAQTSKYVSSVAVDANGVITVTATGTGDSGIDTKSITLTPTGATGTALTFTGTSQQVGGWKCGPAATNGITPKFLPGSCRG